MLQWLIDSNWASLLCVLCVYCWPLKGFSTIWCDTVLKSWVLLVPSGSKSRHFHSDEFQCPATKWWCPSAAAADSAGLYRLFNNCWQRFYKTFWIKHTRHTAAGPRSYCVFVVKWKPTPQRHWILYSRRAAYRNSTATVRAAGVAVLFIIYAKRQKWASRTTFNYNRQQNNNNRLMKSNLKIKIKKQKQFSLIWLQIQFY